MRLRVLAAAGAPALVAGLALAAGLARATSMLVLPPVPLARCADRADLIVVGRDEFVLPDSASGRGVPVIGVEVDTVLAGRLSPVRGVRSTTLQVAWLGPAMWTPRMATGRSAIWFLNRAPGGWIQRFGMAPRAAPRTADEAADLIDSLGASTPVPAARGRAALYRYLEGQVHRLPVSPVKRLRSVRAVPDR